MARDGATAPAPSRRERHARREGGRQLRQKLQLFRRQDLERWLEDNGVSETEFGRLASEEARLAGARDAHWLEGMVDELRLAGLLAPLLDRARRKQIALAERGVEDGRRDTPGGLATLLGWHCARHGLPGLRTQKPTGRL